MKDITHKTWPRIGSGMVEPGLPSSFLRVSAVCLLAGIVTLLTTDTVALHLAFNSFHSPALDAVMKGVTMVGDGWTAVLVTVVLWGLHRRAAIICGAANIAAGLLAQGLKRFVFPGALRPSAVFEQMHLSLPGVPGVQLFSSNSFPSGHAATAWATFFILATLTRRTSLQLLLLGAALLVSYSRVYLSQHFFADILGGAVLGTMCAYAAYRVVTGSERPSPPSGAE